MNACWDELDPSLHIAYIAAQAETPMLPCSICNEVDNTAEDCALAPMAPPTKWPTTSSRDMWRSGLARSRWLLTGPNFWLHSAFAFPGVKESVFSQALANSSTSVQPVGGSMPSRTALNLFQTQVLQKVLHMTKLTNENHVSP